MNSECPFCQTTAPLIFQVSDRNLKISSQLFDYYRCPNCRLIFLKPIPSDLGRYYPKVYYGVPKSLGELQHVVEQRRYRLDILQRYAGSGRKLLEIGGGYGDFAYLAKSVGYEVDVIEMDADCCQFIESIVQAHTFHTNDIPDALQKLGTYDVIALWQVIEHVLDPWGLLSLIAQHLNPNGILVLATPNPNAFQLKVFRKRWSHFEAPRHLNFIPSAVLSKFAHGLGLKTRLATSTDHESIICNTMGWKRSLMGLVGISAGEKVAFGQQEAFQAKRGSLVFGVSKAILRLFVGLITVILLPIERTGFRGTTYTMVFQKDDQPAA